MRQTLALIAAAVAVAAVAALAATQVAAAEARVAETAAAPAPADALETVARRHAIAMHGDPLYPPGFDHFAYVRPDAPQGGRLRIGALGSFDSLNPFIIKGSHAAGLRDFVYESLLTRGLDEPFTLYGLIAESVEMPEDRSSITFHIHPSARFSDGERIDADDLLFSWQVLRDHGRPNHRAYYRKVTRAVKLGASSVRFELEPGDRELALILGLMPVLPAHLMDEVSFQRTTLAPPVGSGPYRVGAIEPGRSITFARNEAWWGADLPVNRGRFNFSEIRFDYYRDDAAMLEAFRSGQIDVRPEEDPGRWAEGYGSGRRAGAEIVKSQFSIGLPAGMTALVFNARRPVFADQRVRQALIHLFDFEWINSNVYHGLYSRTQSFFERSILASTGRPADARERELLAPFPGAVREDVMAGTYRAPVSDGSGRNRDNWRIAMGLLEEAGYRLEGGRLVNASTGTQLGFEILAASAAQERLFLIFARDLERLGIKARIRVVDSSQYQARLKTYDYDMIQWRWPSSLSPGNEQLFRFSSSIADSEGSFNFAGVKNPAADAMIAEMLAADDADRFQSAVRALDRVLLSGDYVIPLFHLEQQWVAHWPQFQPPAKTSLFGYQIDTWWMGPREEARAERP